MKYLFLLYGKALPEPGSAEARRMIEDYGAAKEAMAQAGVLVDCQPLYPPSATTTIRVRGDEVLVTDGPAAEIKEQFGGYTIVECADLDEALTWAATIPAARELHVEIRPVVQMQEPV